jgi:hypothetical protein
MRLSMAFAAALLVSLTASRAGNIDFGTVEMSGSASFSRYSSESATSTGFSLNPGVAIYLAPFVNIGPVLSWSHYTTEYDEDSFSKYSSTALDMGGKVGFLVNYSDGFGRPLPYFDFGLGVESVSQKFAQSSSDNGVFFFGVAGVKLKIGECFYLSLYESYHRSSVSTFENQITSGVGFSGIIGP